MIRFFIFQVAFHLYFVTRFWQIICRIELPLAYLGKSWWNVSPFLTSYIRVFILKVDAVNRFKSPWKSLCMWDTMPILRNELAKIDHLKRNLPSCGGGLLLQQIPTENRGAIRAGERLKTCSKCTVLANWWRYAFYIVELRIFSTDRFQLENLYRYARSYHKLKY